MLQAKRIFSVKLSRHLIRSLLFTQHTDHELVLDSDDTHHHHGDHKAGNSVIEAIYHIICVVAGSGILQLPYALNQSGWIGVGLVLFAASANFYSGSLLVKCLYPTATTAKDPGIAPRRLHGFAHIGQEAFGPYGKLLVEAFADISLLVSQKPRLISAFGVFATIVVIATVVFYSIHDLPLNYGTVTHKFVDLSQFASALGSISFSYSGNFIYPEVEASMAEPKKFRIVLSLSMTIISVMYLVTAIIGYAAYGNTTDSPILNNLPPGFISNFSIFVITAHVMLAIPVLVTTFSLDIERRLNLVKLAGGNLLQEGRYRIALRCVIIFVIVLLAILVPFFRDFMTLLGAIANTLFGFRNRKWSEKVFGIIILFVGLFGGVVGGYEAIVTLVNDINGLGNSGKPGGH
ncbi:hypothetical protein HK100_006395 [Physocladia obscura]|uniref:Amino acid transporter transmembrane domain-containing protein n=1 Tax=Physocladia obscura TaxID=109957 RepID=A0AAD5T7Z0_9FUNG|nr:hypothetical protein HK100_006395 [Physocladia obscura]